MATISASESPHLRSLGYAFREPERLAEALTHRSAGRVHNERLEFLGDAVLSAAATAALYRRYPRATEGELTRWRAELVREATLAAVARELGLGDVLRLGPGELKSGGFRRDSILADALEAVIGAVYLDGGWEASEALVRRLFDARIEAIEAARPPKDAKTRLQEHLQAQGLALPEYVLVAAEGEDHDKVFTARCSVTALAISAEGRGGSRRAAETAAAAAVLTRFPDAPP